LRGAAVLHDISQVAQGIYCLTRPLEGYGMNVSSTLIAAAGQAVIIDTFASPRHLQPFAEFIETASELAADSRVAWATGIWVVYTHSDWDHCLGTGAIEDAFGPAGVGRIVSHCLTRRRMEEQGTKDIQRLARVNPSLVEGARVVFPNITFSQKACLHLNREPLHRNSCHIAQAEGDNQLAEAHNFQGQASCCTLELTHVGGHTPDSVTCYIPEQKVLVAGDLVEDPIPSVTDPSGLDKWIQCLEYYAEITGVVVPSHGEVQGPEILKRNARYLRSLKELAERPGKDAAPLCQVDPEASRIIDSLGPGQKESYLGIHKGNVRVLTQG